MPGDTSSHLMDTRLGCPLPHRLPVIVERDGAEAPQHCQAHVEHDRLDESAFQDPRRDEFAEPVAPYILVDRDGDEEQARHWLVAIDGVGGRDGGYSHDLNPGARVSDDHDGLDGSS